MNMPRAAACLIGVVKVAEQEFKKQKAHGDNTAALDLEGLAAVRDTLERMDLVFGIFYQVPLTEQEKEAAVEDIVVPDEVLDSVSQRSAAKEAKDWQLADSLRNRITELGFAVKDVKGGRTNY